MNEDERTSPLTPKAEAWAGDQCHFRRFNSWHFIVAVAIKLK